MAARICSVALIGGLGEPAIAARAVRGQHGHLAHLQRLARARDLAHERDDLLQGEHLARPFAGHGVGLEHALEGGRFRLAALDEAGGEAPRLLLGRAPVRFRDLHDVGFELALDLQGARLLALDLGRDLGDLGLHLALRLRDQGLAPRARVRDALVRLLARDGEVGVDLGDLGGGGVRGLLDLRVRGEPGLRDGGVHAHARALDAADRVQVPDVVGERDHELERRRRRFKGYASDEIVGRHYSSSTPRGRSQSGRPARELAGDREGRVEDEGWRVRKDGRRSGRTYITALRDLTRPARRVREGDARSHRTRAKALRLSEERFRLLVGSVKDYGIFMLDPEGRVASWNRARSASRATRPTRSSAGTSPCSIPKRPAR